METVKYKCNLCGGYNLDQEATIYLPANKDEFTLDEIKRALDGMYFLPNFVCLDCEVLLQRSEYTEEWNENEERNS